jgi:hypothetical protein
MCIMGHSDLILAYHHVQVIGYSTASRTQAHSGAVLMVPCSPLVPPSYSHGYRES